MAKTYFNSKEVEKFLQMTNNSFAALCWHNDMVVNGAEYQEYIKVSQWFQRYFRTPNNKYIFDLLNSQVLQYSF